MLCDGWLHVFVFLLGVAGFVGRVEDFGFGASARNSPSRVLFFRRVVFPSCCRASRFMVGGPCCRNLCPS